VPESNAIKKIPTIFKRDPENMHELLDEPHPDCLWVFTGEGVATQKYDGTCVMIENGKYFKRREVKKGKKSPIGFVEISLDPNTGKRVGWIEVDPEDKGDKWHMAAFDETVPDGTYELCGPKIQGNPEHYDEHLLIRHAAAKQFVDVPRDFGGIKQWLDGKDIEGLVFHHPDGRMGKIKKRDFDLKRA